MKRDIDWGRSQLEHYIGGADLVDKYPSVNSETILTAPSYALNYARQVLKAYEDVYDPILLSIPGSDGSNVAQIDRVKDALECAQNGNWTQMKNLLISHAFCIMDMHLLSHRKRQRALITLACSLPTEGTKK